MSRGLSRYLFGSTLGWGRKVENAILDHARANLAPYKRIRRLEFADLPKTISGKIRRVELRTAEQDRGDERPVGEYRDDDAR